MTSENKFSLLRRLLRTIGLSQQSADDVVNFIVDLLAGESKDSKETETGNPFPYFQRENFLSPAELAFYEVLRTVAGSKVTICAKVALGDLFYVTKEDQSRYRIYTNKIDRKHVDFLLCEPITMRPLMGIELDDSSHQRADRRERDAFVDGVFKAAGLPLLHVPVKRTYSNAELATQLTQTLRGTTSTVQPPPMVTSDESGKTPTAPTCPKCGSPMLLRTAKSGANAGNRFWGCSKYPSCKGVVTFNA